jgi:M6 family metalloprotease-like protein
MVIRNYLFMLALHFVVFQSLQAAPIFNKEYELRQPDGSFVRTIVSGDEFYQDVETVDGYSLIRDSVTKWICYAKVSSDGQTLISTGIVYTTKSALEKNPSVQGIEKHLRVSSKSIQKIRNQKFFELNKKSVEQMKMDLPIRALSKTVATTVDTIYGITILIDFPDQKSSIPIDSITNFLNMTGYTGYKNNGSVRDFYFDISAGKLVYIQRITPFITAKNNKSYYDRTDGSDYAGSDELVKEILTTLKNQGTFNFSLATLKNKVVQAVNMLYAGTADAGWAQGLWPHSGYTNFSINGVTVQKHMLSDLGTSLTLNAFCHENGHMLCGWQDLYTYDDHSQGAGAYDLMSGASNERNPIPPNSFLRSLMGWTSVIEISKDSLGKVYKIPSNSNVAYFYSGNSATSAQELFCIEAHRRNGRYVSIPDTGLLIWHIDKAGDNTTTGQNDYAVPEQTDGKNDLENKKNSGGAGDLYHAGYVVRFNDTTTPSAKWHNGKTSGIQVANIGPIADTMTFSLGGDITTGIDNAHFANNSNLLQYNAVKKVLSYCLDVNTSDPKVMVKVDLFSLNGQLVRTVINENQLTGVVQRINLGTAGFGNGNIPAGKYLCKLTAGTYRASKQIVIQ